jgi:GT2 family glycosyltransferase
VTSARVDAVVVRWRGGREVDHCLESLLGHGGAVLGHIVLVDSGSGDAGADRLRTEFPEVDVVALQRNRSFAWAAARGAERCDGPLLLLLNPDTRVEPGALSCLVEALEERDSAAGAAPALVNPDGSSQHRWQLRRLPGPRRLALGLPGAAQFPKAAPDRPRSVEQPAASAWLIRRRVWDALGGLDPLFAPAWWEDVDFCARLESALAERALMVTEGFITVPAATVVHSGGSSLDRLEDVEFLAVYFRNLIRYAARHHRRSLAMITSGLRLSLAARALARTSRRSAYLETMRAVPGWAAEEL